MRVGRVAERRPRKNERNAFARCVGFCREFVSNATSRTLENLSPIRSEKVKQ